MTSYAGKYIDGDGVSHLWAKIKLAFAAISHTHAWGDITNPPTIPSASSTTPKMDGTAAVGSETAWARGDHIHPTDTSRQATLVSGTNIKTVGSQSLLGSGNLTPANIGAAASSHAHGNITSGGDITATAPTVASGDKLIINDESASKITNGPSFGTSTTKYLRNDGTWDTPAGTIYYDFSGASGSSAGSNGLVPAPGAGEGAFLLVGDGDWHDLNEVFSFLFPQSSLAAGYIYYSSEAEELSVDSSGTLMTSSQSSKLATIATGAEVNQNAFSNVKVGSTTVAADSKTDTLELVAGDNVTLTPDATNDKVTISATDTVYTHPSYTAHSTSAIYKFKNDATGHVSEATAATASDVVTLLGTTAVNRATGDASGNNIANTYAPKASPALTGIPTAPTATTGTDTTQIATTAFVNASIASAQTGAATFKGTLGSSGADYTQAQLEASSYKAGWYWVVKVAGTYVGQTCEVGDMVFCSTSKGSGSYSASHFSVVQNNILTLSSTEIDAICV